jgi:hypothetical protein
LETNPEKYITGFLRAIQATPENYEESVRKEAEGKLSLLLENYKQGKISGDEACHGAANIFGKLSRRK